MDGLDMIVELLESAWREAPEDELRVVLEELAHPFQLMTEGNVRGALLSGLRFFYFFLERQIYCEEDGPLMIWLLEMDAVEDQHCHELHEALIAYWASTS
jgi:hypothetical protein